MSKKQELAGRPIQAFFWLEWEAVMEVLLLLRASILWILRFAQNDAFLVHSAAQIRGGS